MATNPWFEDYECDGCGACCIPLRVPVSEEDMRREPKIRSVIEARHELPMADNEYGKHYWLGDGIGNEPCPFLETDGACAIHATKPRCCHQFKAGKELCQWARGRAGLGPLYPRYNLKMVNHANSH